MIDITDFRTLVVRPTLQYLGAYSAAAEELLIGTALVESRLTYLQQWDAGPALGLYQVEPATHRDIYANYLVYRAPLRQRVVTLASGQEPIAIEANGKTIRVPPVEELITNLAYATAIARLCYLRRKEPLPAADDLVALGDYWKRYYNSARGAGTVEKFVEIYTAQIEGDDYAIA